MGRLSTAYRQKKREARLKAFSEDSSKNINNSIEHTARPGISPVAVIKDITTFLDGIAKSALDALASVPDVPGPSETEMAAFVDEDTISLAENTPSEDESTTSMTETMPSIHDMEADDTKIGDTFSLAVDNVYRVLPEAGKKASDLIREQKSRKKEKRRARKAARMTKPTDPERSSETELASMRGLDVSAQTRHIQCQPDDEQRRPKGLVLGYQLQPGKDDPSNAVKSYATPDRAGELVVQLPVQDTNLEREEHKEQDVKDEVESSAELEVCGISGHQKGTRLIIFEDEPDSMFKDHVSDRRTAWLFGFNW
ncbi:uncharacterized protein VDAG_08492 [Verticillium dahliae VdLs.17]|uniref:Uncharacterized protein n=2 Tax=Verticillium dahliae TaxID=27337 RepID=G2XEB0_VERDV|nr:uncharacterized protein VDAG_08492 [Verticillium dahliae VdLs.17]EGY18158.1 hypothetical protein VDAG_08492 [Verticillium dahliae VdLs.17]KAF3346862.1 Zinc finger protein [Verticillium dahliae VDG2]KAH6698913.1 hypothetical protein EV126DRAFT_55731 [Verticillium dahliae]PNH30729.1 hypothetical protein BJF96_g6068 [Verticillium dahliae]